MSYKGFDYFSAEIVTEVQLSPYLGDGTVVDYAAAEFASYPAVVVTPASLSGEFGDTSRVTDSFKFTVLILANRLNNESQVERGLRQFADDLIQRLQNNTTINNQTSTFLRPIGVTWGYATAPDPDMRIVNLTVEIIVGQ